MSGQFFVAVIVVLVAIVVLGTRHTKMKSIQETWRLLEERHLQINTMK